MARPIKTKRGENDVIFSLRIDDDLRLQLKDHADRNDRTLTGEMIHRLKASLKGSRRTLQPVE